MLSLSGGEVNASAAMTCGSGCLKRQACRAAWSWDGNVLHARSSAEVVFGALEHDTLVASALPSWRRADRWLTPRCRIAISRASRHLQADRELTARCAAAHGGFGS